MTPATQKRRVDSFGRWMLEKERANRRAGKPGFYQTSLMHRCGTPACVGGYLSTYPPFIAAQKKNPTLDWAHGEDGEGPGYLGDLGPSAWWEHFSGCNLAIQNRNALQAVNALRKAVGLKPFKSVSEALK